LERRSDSGELHWRIEAKASQIEIDPESRVEGELKNVEGTLYEKGQVASTFTATEASANQQNSHLELRGEVKVLGHKDGLVLKAQRVRWLPERQLIEASGRVMLENASFTVGPFPRLLSTPDLKQTGTPDVFSTQAKGIKKPEP